MLLVLADEECELIDKALIQKDIKIGDIIRNIVNGKTYRVEGLISGYGLSKLNLIVRKTRDCGLCVEGDCISLVDIDLYYEKTRLTNIMHINKNNRIEYNKVIKHVKLRKNIQIGSILKMNKPSTYAVVVGYYREEKTRVYCYIIHKKDEDILKELKDLGSDLQDRLVFYAVENFIFNNVVYVGQYKDMEGLSKILLKYKISGLL